MKNPRKSCTYCNEFGHYKPRCPAWQYDQGRIKAIDGATAATQAALPQAKNPAHWEVLNQKRDIVKVQLAQALDELSATAPAAKYIKRAMTLLEDMK